MATPAPARPIKNIIGKPVSGTSFFNRFKEIQQLEELLEGDDVLLLAPRRVGKTSVLMRMQERAAARNVVCCYASVASATAEKEFLRQLLEAVLTQKATLEVVESLKQSAVGSMLGRIQKLGMVGATVELKPEADGHWRELGEELVQALSTLSLPCVMCVDEIAVFVLTLQRADPSGDRARDFLTWFAEVRGRGRGVQWAAAGSIGLGTVAHRLNASATLKFRRYDGIGAFDQHDAAELLEQLALAYDIHFDAESIDHACQRIGWLIPHHLQILFSEIHALRRTTPISMNDVDAAYEAMLAPGKRNYFDHWSERLRKELDAADASLAFSMLDEAASTPTGTELSTLKARVKPSGDMTQNNEERLRFVLSVLQSDGYLVVDDGRVLFRSPLLRDYWHKRTS